MNIYSKSHSRDSRPAFWKTLILVVAIVVNATLIFRLFWGPQSIVSYRELVAQYADLTQEIERYDAVNAALSREIRLLQSDEKYVEKMIRQRLNFVRSNEILYLFTGTTHAGASADEGKN